MVAGALATLLLAGSASAANPTLRIVPDQPKVPKGATFTVRVVQHADMAISGAQATVTFDQTKVQIQSVTRGQPYANAPVVVPPDLTGAISQANGNGKLKELAAAFTFPDNVATGDQDYLVISLKAVGCGTVNFGLPVGQTDAIMLDGRTDTYGAYLMPTTSGASVTIDCGGAAAITTAAGSASAGASDSGGAISSDIAVAGASSGSSDSPPPDSPTSAGGTSSGSGGGLPLWLPLVLAIPAIAIVGLGLLRSRKPTTS
jgi:hypothetical protein